MDWVRPWMQRILDMDLQFTRQRFGYQQLKEAMKLEQDTGPRKVQEFGTSGEDVLEKLREERSLQQVQELDNWEEDKLVELIQDSL
jgi:hypothetical protein